MKDEYSDSVTIGRARKDDLLGIFALLGRCELPKEDLEPHLSTTLVARKDNRVVGCSVLELYQECALLAYVAVEASFRGRRIGQRLTKGALDLARHHQARTVYLLTETATMFFHKFGFKSIQLSDVPQNVQQSDEFTTLCPDTATVMMASLDRS